MSGTHRLGVVTELPAILLELGVDPKPVLAAAGVPAELLRNPENRIPFPVLGRLLHEAVAASGCPHLGLLVGRRGGLQSLGLVGRLMSTAPTVREAIMDLCINQVRFIEGAVTHLTLHDGGGLWAYSVQAPPLQGIDAILDGAIGIGVSVVQQLSGHRAEEVRFSHAQPKDVDAYRVALGVTPVFNVEQTCLVLSREVLAAPVRTADPVLRRILQRQVVVYWARAQPSMAEQVQRALAAHVTTGEASLEIVAAVFGIGPRTLTRRLRAEGTSFRAVLEQARHDVARQLLGGTRMPVTEIGFSLGYASPPGFVRAFRRAAGQPPSEWRRFWSGDGNPLAAAARSEDDWSETSSPLG
ncbi:MAG: AraC family transcriptional regulator [Acetobacteraceae bacterium]